MSLDFASLLARDVSAPTAQETTGVSHTMTTLLIVILVLFGIAVVLVGALWYLRRRRIARKQDLLPIYDEKRSSTSSTSSAHRRVMTRPSESIHVRQEQQTLMENSDSPPPSPLPAIHITLPEEIDDAGKRLSGRTVVVHIGEKGVALEPTEALPPYQQTQGERFQSIDLERIGGLVEKPKV